MHTTVAIIGGGPAGSLLSHLLHLRGVDSVILERRSKAHVLGRIRAGVLEQGTREVLLAAGLGDRMVEGADEHEGVELTTGEERVRVDFRDTVDRAVTVWGQTEVQRDLYDALEARDAILLDEVDDVELHDLTTQRPRVTFTRDGEHHELTADWVAGCDGSRGPSRAAIPDEVQLVHERSYPFGWLGILSETPPVSDELIYASHDDGFALCSMRHAMLSRYYVQCDLDDEPEEWSDDRVWTALATRLPAEAAASLVTGPSIEKSITPLRSIVTEPMRWGRLLLAGDAAHVVPPTGAKGLNLAIGDVTLLADALARAITDGDHEGLDRYSDTALRRVWMAVRFSWWLTTMLHRFPSRDAFARRIQVAELHQLQTSASARALFADNYTGLPIDPHHSGGIDRLLGAGRGGLTRT